MYNYNIEASKKQIIKIALVSITSNILLVLFLGFITAVYVWIFNPHIQIGTYVLRKGGNPIISVSKDPVKKEVEEYNNANWQRYYAEWKETKKKMSVFVSCKSDIDTAHSNLEDKHKEYLKAQINNAQSKELRFYEGLYRYTEELSSTLRDIISTYKLDENAPEALPEMYIIENNPEYTKETATIRLSQVLSDFERIRGYADSFSCMDTSEVTYANKEKICDAIIGLNYSAMKVTQPIYREAFEIEEQYKLALKEYQDEKVYALYECTNNHESYR